jgi:hypothetical protein
VCATVLLLCAGLIVYSQTLAFSFDEGFHLVASRLIESGKTPYLDFCFPQPPLNAYWNAAWMRIFGDSWRVPHVFAALLVGGAVMLAADFTFRRFPVQRWRLVCTLITVFTIAVSVPVVQFGTLQAYGMCLFLIVVAFRLAVFSIGRKGFLNPFAAGLLAGAAAASSLLTTPVAPVLLIWMWVYNRLGSRLIKSAAFLLGAAIPFSPVLWLFVKAPRVVFFNIVEYQLFYRRVNWEGATPHDVDVLTAWVNSSQALLMALFALVGFWFIRSESGWERSRRAEFFLSGWLAVVFIAYLSFAHPTFERYFLFAVPFLAIPAAVGLYAIASRLGYKGSPAWPAGLVIALLCLGLAKRLFDNRDSYKWRNYEEIAAKVKQVTPQNGTLWADEVVYFLLRQTPPPGMEFSYSHKLDLTPPLAASLHIMSERELQRRLKAGIFSTVETCADEDKIDQLSLERLYAHRADVSDCAVFWGKRTKTTR